MLSQQRYRRYAIPLAVVWACVILTAVNRLLPAIPRITPISPFEHHESQSPRHEERPAYARLVYSHRESGWNLCSSLFSALALGYPTPYLAGWPKGPTTSDEPAQGILDIYRYLTQVGSGANDDLVIVVDGMPVWWQQKLDTLISGYFSMLHDRDHSGARKVVVSVSNLADGSTSMLSVGPLNAMRRVYTALFDRLRGMEPLSRTSPDLKIYQLLSPNMLDMVIMDDRHELLGNAANPSEKSPNKVETLLPLPLLGQNYQGPNFTMPNESVIGSPGETDVGAIHAPLDVAESLSSWRRLWFYPQLRSMMRSEAVSHFGSFQTVSGNITRHWWRFPAYGRGLDSVLVEDREAMPLQELCQADGRGAFADGGEWTTIGRNSLGDG